MPAFQHDHVFVGAAHQVVQQRHRAPGGDVIVARGDGQGGRADRAQVNALPVDLQPALHQQIALVEVLDVLAEGFAGEGRRVVEPDLHGGEAAHEALVFAAFPVIERLHQLVGRAHHVEGHVEQRRGDVAQRVHVQVGVHPLRVRPQAVDALVVVIDRPGQVDHGSDIIRVEHGVDRSEQPAHAVAEQRDGAAPAGLADSGYRAPQQPGDVLVERAVAIHRRGRPPVEHVDIYAPSQQVAHQRPLRDQVHDVMAVDQRGDAQQRDRARDRDLGRVAQQAGAPLRPHDGRRSLADQGAALGKDSFLGGDVAFPHLLQAQ